MKSLLKLLPLLIILMGCAPTLVRPPERVDNPAEQAYARGEYATAARAFERMADQAPLERRTDYWLSAADAWAAAGNTDRAHELLGRTTGGGRPTQEQAGQRQLVEARIALEENIPDRTLQILARPEGRSSDATYMARLYGLRAAAHERRGNFLEAARAYVDQTPYLENDGARQENQEAIWQALSHLSLAELQARRERPAPDIMSGWLELAAIAKQYQLSPPALDNLLQQWRHSYPRHPASEALLRSIGDRAQATQQQGGNIAVLLPLSGRFAPAAEAVRDGIMGAYYENGPATGRQVRIYDVGDSPAQTLAAYDQALAEGASAIIGPLSKEGVNALARRGSFPVPTLALNYGDLPATQNLYQFSLAPEDEAQQAAEFAWRRGLTRAALLIPESELGDRLAQGFRARWQQLGGAVVATTLYNPSETDYSVPILELLGMSRSSSSRPREDIDFIFVAASPREGRLIRPMLRFYYAGQLPVIATSHIYGGRPSPRLDQDLDGVIFSDMPWLLEAPGANLALRDQIGRDVRTQDGELARLTAFGVDAYGLISVLPILSRYAGERHQGETGTLSVGEQGRIVREPVWARFEGGTPVLLGDRPVTP